MVSLPSTDPLSSFSPTAPLFLGADGNRITRGTLQYRILRAFKKAGLNGERPSAALVHGLRHTFATELANANVSVYTLMKFFLGHESVATSQRYVDGAGADRPQPSPQRTGVHPHDDPGECAGAHDLAGLIERILQAALGS